MTKLPIPLIAGVLLVRMEPAVDVLEKVGCSGMHSDGDQLNKG